MIRLLKRCCVKYKWSFLIKFSEETILFLFYKQLLLLFFMPTLQRYKIM